MLSSVVLPAPEAPHSASTPPRAAMRASRRNAPNEWAASISITARSSVGDAPRASNSEATIALNAMAIATSVRRTMLVSAPGCCV